MDLDKNFLGEMLLNKTLWWCLTQEGDGVQFKASPALQEMVGAEILDYATFLSYLMPESAHLLEYKSREFMARPEVDERFLVGFKVGEKITWLINKLHLANQGPGDCRVLYSTCVEVSEMYALEEQLIESHSRLMIEQLRAKEEMAKKEAQILQQQYDDQTQFLAMLSHELRSPLMGMNSLVSVVKKKQLANEDASDDLKTMRLTIEQLNFLINDILTFAQTEFGSIQLKPTVFELDQLGEYVSHLTKSIASEKGIFVSFAISSRNNCFYGDLVRVSQILVNLIVNAIKFTDIGGVFVEIRELDNELEIQVSDSGVGMDEKDLKNIFKPFKQLDSDAGPRYVGSGLGLAIVKTLVDLMGGRTYVESTKGVGSLFTVNLPMEVKSCPTTELARGDECDTCSELALSDNFQCDFDVLIADDSKINQKVLETFLEQLGCRVDQAHDGNQAWAKFQQKPYDFVFLDIQMPGMSGAEVCQKIRELPAEAKTGLQGVFALTAAHTVNEVEQMGIEIDQSMFDEWVEKPISQDKIIHLLHCKEHPAAEPEPKEMASTDELQETESLASQIPEHLQHLVPQLLENTHQEIAEVRKLLYEVDEAAIRKVLHRMKGNLMLFNVGELLEAVREMERMASYQNREDVEARLVQLENQLRQLG